MLEYQNTKTFLLKDIPQTSLNIPWTYVINDLNGKEITRTFSEKNYKKQIKKDL